MAAQHSYYVSLGANILPEQNLQAAIQLLRKSGDIREISGVWESEAVGSAGPNFLNMAVRFLTDLGESQLEVEVLDEIEAALGRVRTKDKNAPRTIDLDVILVDGRPVDLALWEHAFVVLPMAELLPELLHPLTGRRLVDQARIAGTQLWIRRRPELSRF